MSVSVLGPTITSLLMSRNDCFVFRICSGQRQIGGGSPARLQVDSAIVCFVDWRVFDLRASL